MLIAQPTSVNIWSTISKPEITRHHKSIIAMLTPTMITKTHTTKCVTFILRRSYCLRALNHSWTSFMIASAEGMVFFPLRLGFCPAA